MSSPTSDPHGHPGPSSQSDFHGPYPQTGTPGQYWASTGGYDAPGAGPQDYVPPRPGAPRQVTAQDRTTATLTHLTPLLAMLFTVGWLSFAGPLIMWAVHKDNNDFVRRSAAAAFNFNLSMWLLGVIGWVCVLTLLLIPVGVPLLLFAFFVQIILHIVAAVRANQGEIYRYPMQFLNVLS
ncbi:hypothetical protein SAMN05421595_0404 [Austwickia chelonae]|uniref:DUF4870 domain-containing protein n=1 Tax=Austwickia chelonae NBRC 105200 TaxID=1184607 RepID=K6V6N5_9MICO|nr:DUF4870 domain-containing protein [Austwickia chelonae]GAB77893.1 hypothetical protein AUCHE_08_01360 [Austwickia chelonae NBRC 105200]SEV91673.1 hypothetical protein SAMN05421595_0404 [Austwickia chelonae]